MRVWVVIAAALVAVPAVAQDGGFDAHGFVLTAQDGDVRDHYTLHRPGSLTAGEWFVGGLLEYANRPLVLVTEAPNVDDEVAIALNDVFALNLSGGAAPFDFVRVTASIPVHLTSSSFTESQGATLGDMRLAAEFVAPRTAEESRIGVGLVPWIDLPTGAPDKFLGRRAVGGGFVLGGTYELDRVTFTANLGAQFEPAVELENLDGADSLVAGLGANALLTERSSLGAEARIVSALDENDRAWTGSPAELTLAYRHRTEVGAHFSGGFAVPLSPGAGAAAFRVFLGGGFGQIGARGPKDRDLDGITDDIDACLDQPETINGYIDADGCPDALSQLTVAVTYDGEPVDAQLTISGPDGDQRVDLDADSPWKDAVHPDTTWAFSARRGACLAGDTKTLVGEGAHDVQVPIVLVPSATVRVAVKDQAGAPVPGATLAWQSDTPECVPEAIQADSAGVATADVGPGVHKIVIAADNYRISEVPILAESGDEIPVEVVLTPTKLRVEKSRIVILEKVQFDSGRATIRPVSFDLLDEVADVIARNPAAGRVEVQGHTDSQGSDASNLDLSQRRAEAVRDYLSDKGVDRARLLAIGYGEAKPVDTNATRSGRAANRRVEFHLVDQAGQSIEEDATDE